MLYHASFCNVMSYQIMLHYIKSYHVVLCHFMSCHLISFHAMRNIAFSCVLSWSAMSRVKSSIRADENSLH